MKYEPMGGKNIESCAKTICDMAERNHTTVTMSFNGMEFKANPGDTQDTIMAEWYRQMGITDIEKHKRETAIYPETVEEWLRRWDSGKSVWSVSMGGIGPSYEQCIQITAAEMMRSLLASDIDLERFKSDKSYNRELWDSIESTENVKAVFDRLGLSGAQVGAAKNLAAIFYRKGPDVAMSDKAVKDRTILVNKEVPR